MKWWHALIAAAVVAGLWFAYYAISPLFRNVRLDEAVPAGAPPVSMSTSGVSEGTPMTGAPAAAGAPVIGTVGHPASGTARIIKTPEGSYLRYENLKTINGPDLYVYLSKDLAAKEFINLGKLKGTEGNINYVIPSNVDSSEYPYALTWCRAFGVLFNSAEFTR